MPRYDLECISCSYVHEETLLYQESPIYLIECSECNKKTEHKRLPSLFSRYMGEAPLNPMVQGGKFDTMGFGKVQDVDMPKEDKEHQEKINKVYSSLPDGATREEVNEALRVVERPSIDVYKDHFNKKEVKEKIEKRNHDVKINRMKRKRARAIERGENINMKWDKVPGQPKVNS